MRRAPLLVTLLLAAASARAAESVPAAKEADIRLLLEAMGATRIGAVMTESVVRQMGEAFRRGRPGLPPAVIDSMGKDVGAIFGKALSERGGLVDRLVPLYHRQFTHEEIRGMLRFYESPLGRKVAQTLPALTQESVEVGQEWGESLAPRIESAVAARLRQAGQEP